MMVNPMPRNHRARRKCVVHPARDLPARQIHIHRHLIVQFNVFPLRFLRARVVVDLIEDDDRVRPGSSGEQGKE